MRIALPNRSTGRYAAFFGGCHQKSAPTTARLLIALNQNGAATPILATIKPPSAGPMARLTLTPTLFAATAALRSCPGTSCGTIDCQTGAVSAAPTPMRNVNSNRLPGVAAPIQTTTANIAATVV